MRGRYPYHSIVMTLKSSLSQWGPYVHSWSGASVYLRFEKVPHQLRISDHDERSKYNSKWQLRLDWDGEGEPKRRRHPSGPQPQFFHEAVDLIEAFNAYYSSPLSQIYGK
jgi:hypothetical protein